MVGVNVMEDKGHQLRHEQGWEDRVGRIRRQLKFGSLCHELDGVSWISTEFSQIKGCFGTS